MSETVVKYECLGCGEKDPLKFDKRNRSRCKLCIRAYQRELIKNNDEYAAKKRERMRAWYHKNKEVRKSYDSERKKAAREKEPEKFRKRQTEEWKQVKRQVIEMYGGKCTCCGESNQFFLTLDHINNNGAEERKEIKQQGIYRRIRREGVSDQYQILCMNCNFGKYRNGGICPHKEGKEKITQ